MVNNLAPISVKYYNGEGPPKNFLSYFSPDWTIEDFTNNFRDNTAKGIIPEGKNLRVIVCGEIPDMGASCQSFMLIPAVHVILV
jgi:hypothetical protein